MNVPAPNPNALHRLVHTLSTSRAGAKFFSQILHRIDSPILELTGGRFALSGMFTGLPLVMLTTQGARTGQPRTMPLVGFPDGDKLFLIASNWGGTKYPAWYHNLRANPQATVSYGGQSAAFAAREAHGKEYATYWKRATDAYRGYEAYKSRTGGRPIPIMVLEPV